jgi:hypothetical protein
MTFQKRLQRVMRKRGMRVADLARWFDEPYTTVREWVLNGRELSNEASNVAEARRAGIEQRLHSLERSKA